MWGVLLLECTLKWKMNRISIFTSQIFFAVVKEDEKKLTGIMWSKVGCSNYLSMLDKYG